MKLLTLLTSAALALALPAFPHYNTTTDLTAELDTKFNTNVTTRGDGDEMSRRWDKKKITIWTYSKPGNSCKGHGPQSKHKLQPFKCKNFGWFDKFSEVQFELPKEVHQEGINCGVEFFYDNDCESDKKAGSVVNRDERPACDNKVGVNWRRKSAVAKCWTN